MTFLNNIHPDSYFDQLIKQHPDLDPHKPKFLRDILKEFEDKLLADQKLKQLLFNHITKHITKNCSALSGMNLYDPTPDDMEIMKAVYNAGLSPYWLIPAQIYKAIISRDLARRQGRISRGVSMRTLEQCAEQIMHNIGILLVNEEMMEGDLTDLACKFDVMFPRICNAFRDASSFEVQRELDKHKRLYADISFAFYWYYMVSCSFVGPSDPEFPVANTDRDDTWDKIQNMLNQLPANPDEDQFIVFINKFIDLCHGRGSLAGAFVEGGAATCSAVSNMKADELYEATSHCKYTKRQIQKAIRYWQNVLKTINESNLQKKM